MRNIFNRYEIAVIKNIDVPTAGLVDGIIQALIEKNFPKTI